jgi:NAD(P)-dependent dehydrogenase (short-subunit alcohol dehydrogenase family)
MRRVLITGGSRGIGRAIVRRFDAAGDSVFFSYASNVDEAEQTVRHAPHAIPFAVDLRAEDGPERLVSAAEQRLGGIDVLVNCAGIYPHATFADTPPSLLEEVMRVNFEAPYRLMQLAAVPIAAAGGGAIVNVTSINATSPDTGLSAYDASKAALAQAVRTAALELGARHIRVNAVAPGLVDAPELEHEAPDRRAAFLAHAPLGILVTPTDIAEAVFFLASPAATAVTGQTLVVDAGVTLAGYNA